MTMYAIVLGSERTSKDGYTSSRQSPTFYLDSTVQGIVSAEHAAKIALDIANTFHAAENNDVVTVYAINNDNGSDSFRLVYAKE